MKPKIYVTRKLPKVIYNQLSEHADVRMWEEAEIPVPRDILLQEVRDIDGLFCLLTETIDKEVILQAKKIKIISNMAVGFNNIDVTFAEKQGVVVTNTPGVLTETTADLTFALMMATARRIVEASDYLHKGKWNTWSPMQLTGRDIHGATLGIIGMGRIGEALARRANGFGMNILYYNRSRRLEIEKKLGVTYCDFDSLLQQSDFVSLLLPYSSEVHHLIGEKEFKLMKKTAVLINTARGGIVNEGALYNALISGEIWAAGLDVFEEEPINLESPLLSLPNVVTLPHIGSASEATRLKMAEMTANNLIQVLTGGQPLTPVKIK